MYSTQWPLSFVHSRLLYVRIDKIAYQLIPNNFQSSGMKQ